MFSLNNMNKSVDNLHEGPSQLISDDDFNETLIFWSCLWFVTCSFGIWSNAVIIRTFVRMGIDDSITISFFTLGLSDFGLVFSPIALVVVTILTYVEAKFDVYFEVQPYTVNTFLASWSFTFNGLTTYITTFLAVQRCLCIVKPLHFKDMFSKSLTWRVMVSFLLVSSVPVIAFSATKGTKAVVDPYTNRSQIVYVIKPGFKYVMTYVGTIWFILTPIVSQCLVLGSIIVMGYRLRASMQFRLQATVGKTSSKIKSTQKDSGGNEERSKESKYIDEKRTSKELTAIVQVALLSAIYLVTSIPKIITAIVSLIVPGFRLGGFYENMFSLCVCIRVTFEYINSSVNFFVYYRYNTRFRELCFGDNTKQIQRD